MKLIIAYIQPRKINIVKQMLHERNINRYSICDAYGHSDEPAVMENYRGIEVEVDLTKKTRIEVAVNDNYVQSVVDSLMNGGKEGEIGIGKIFVLPLEECYSIATGNTGSDAIG